MKNTRSARQSKSASPVNGSASCENSSTCNLLGGMCPVRCAEIVARADELDKTRLCRAGTLTLFMIKSTVRKIKIIDSHTGGEPTRIAIEGGPDLGLGPLAARRDKFQREFDRFRSAIVNEPRGSDGVVGALLVQPEDKTCATRVI